MKKRVFIIGAGGVFGNNFGIMCERAGYDVMGCGRSPRRGPAWTLGAQFPYAAYHLTYELEYIMKMIHEFDPHYIVNFAAQGEGAASWGHDNWRFYETNCVGLVRLVGELQRARPQSFDLFVHVGTSELYGSRETPAKEDAPITPTSPYGVSKVAFDLHLDVMWKRMQFPSITIRPCNAYGPGQQLHRVIPKAFLLGLQGQRIDLHGGGKSRKSYLHCDDVSRGIMLAMTKGRIGEIYNIASDEPIAIRTVLEDCAEVMGKTFDEFVDEAPERLGQDGCYWMDSSKAKLELGWRPMVDWTDGLISVRDWVDENLHELAALPNTFTMRA